jgi:hypothetical protein
VTSLVQVGYGNGEWLAEAQRLGIPKVQGIDGPWAEADDLLVGRDQITVMDTRQSFSGGNHDLALCIEYAEHLPDSRAASFAADLAALAPVVAFSAAIPGQGGYGHVNEQWPPYWEAHFAAVGYRMVDAVRHKLWTTPGMPGYLAQNLLVALDERRLADYPRLAQLAAEGGGVLSLVHPAIYDQEKSRREALLPARTPTRARLRAVARRVRHPR